MVKTIFSDFLQSDFLLWSLSLALCVYVPNLEIGGILWLLWEIVGGWRNTIWLLRLDRENASLLFHIGYPWNLPTLLWGSLSRSPSCPHEENLKSLLHSPGWHFICHPESACQPCRWGNTEWILQLPTDETAKSKDEPYPWGPAQISDSGEK